MGFNGDLLGFYWDLMGSIGTSTRKMRKWYIFLDDDPTYSGVFLVRERRHEAGNNGFTCNAHLRRLCIHKFAVLKS